MWNPCKVDVSCVFITFESLLYICKAYDITLVCEKDTKNGSIDFEKLYEFCFFHIIKPHANVGHGEFFVCLSKSIKCSHMS